MTPEDGFAHPEYLVDPQDLQARLADANRSGANLVVVDLDAEAGYLRGHIPGAVHLPDNYERNPETGWVNTFPPDKFAATCERLGIGDDTLVVAYDNNLSLYAARFWWALNYYGHSNVRVLDGGWRRWAAEAGAGSISFDRAAVNSSPASISFDRAAVNSSSADAGDKAGAAFTPRVDDSFIVRFDAVKSGCSLEDTVIWDTRSQGEYSGAINRGNRRAGHIAGAVHLDWLDLMERETHRFKPASEIRRILNEKGMTPDKAVFAY